MKICSQLNRHLMMALLAFVLLGVTTLAHAAQVTATWTGAGDGTTYTDAANWSPAVVPRNGVPSGTTYKAVIDGNNGKVADVNFNTSVTLDALVVTQGDSFNINTGTSLVVINSGAGTGTIVNSGTIRLNAGQFNSAFLRINGDVMLSGGGTVTMTDTTPSVNSNNAAIFGTATTDRLTNVDNTISGGGFIGGEQMVFTNRGTIIATNPNKPLVINPTIRSTDNINTGVLHANGGTLNFQIHTINNAGGTIEALNGSVVELRSPIFNGGTLQTTGSGVFRTTDLNGLPTFANLTTKGNVQIPSNSSLTLVGNIVNNGTIAINEIGDGGGRLFISGDVTLNGGGTVTLADKASGGSLLSAISGRAVTDRLINADNTISGAGAIGDGQMLLTNNGTIIARGTNPLVIRLSVGSNVNNSALRADGGTLILFGSSLANSSGTIEARAASQVKLVGTTINGGTLSTVGSGLVVTDSISSPTNTPVNNVTNTGNLVVSSGSSLTLGGTLTNRGTIAVNGGSNGGASLRISESVTLNGGGTVTLADKMSGGSLLSGISGVNNGGSERLTNADNTIRGAGGVQGITLINNGTILPVGENPLLFLSPITNNGTIRVDAGNTLRINTGLTLTQAAGLLLVNGTFDSIINGPGIVAVTGGTLAGAGTITNNVNNSDGTVSPGNLTGANVSSVGTLTLGANYTQGANGKLFIQIAGSELSSFDRLAVSGAASFAGALDVQLLGVYAPANVDQFKIVDYASRAGSGTMTLNVVDRDNRGGFTQQYNPTNLTLTAQGIPTIGVNLQPTQVFTDTVLTATIVTAASTPVNRVTYDFRVNGLSRQSGTGNTFNLGVAGNGDKNDVISVIAQTDDDRSNQNSVTIQNAKPIAQSSTNNNASGGQLISIPLRGTDLDGDALTFQIVSGARNGVASIRKVGNNFVLDYTARATFSGVENIQFVASDGVTTSAQPATIRIVVTGQAANRPPVIPNNEFKTVTGGQTIDVPIVASDPDGDPITFKSVGGPQNGTGEFLLVNGKPVFRYRSSAQFDGIDVVRFIARDGKAGGDSEIRMISFRVVSPPPVNRAPVAFSSSGITVNAGQGADIIVNVSDSDREDTLDTLFFRTVQFPTKGTLQNVFLRDGRSFFRYLPNADASGTDSFSFVVIDKQGTGLTSNVATISIAITPATPPNRAPVAFSGTATVTADQIIDIPFNVIDPDPADIKRTLTLGIIQPTKGVLLDILDRDGQSFFRYRANLNASGTDLIQFFATDKGGNGLTSNVATISIAITPTQANRAPVAFSSSRQQVVGQAIDITVSAIDPDDGDTIDALFFRVTEQPRGGTITGVSLVNGRVIFRYVPRAGFQGFDSFSFTATDSGGLTSNVATIPIYLRLTPPNRAPVAFSSGTAISREVPNRPNRLPTVANASATTIVGVPIDIPITAFDLDGDSLEFVFPNNVTRSAGGGTIEFIDTTGGPKLRYTPTPNFVGIDTVRFSARDGKPITAGESVGLITITVNYPTSAIKAPVSKEVPTPSDGTS